MEKKFNFQQKKNILINIIIEFVRLIDYQRNDNKCFVQHVLPSHSNAIQLRDLSFCQQFDGGFIFNR